MSDEITPKDQPTTPEYPEGTKFYGPYAIEGEVVDNEKKKITLVFAEMTNQQTKEKMRPDSVELDIDIYNVSVTDKKSDLTALRHKRVTLIVADILVLLLKRNIKLSEFEYMVALLNQSINDSLQKSNQILWGNSEQDRTMEDVDKVLKTGPKSLKNPEPDGESTDEE